HQVGHRLGVGVRAEHHAVGLQLGAQLVEVLDDAVVYHRDPAGQVGVRVRVAVGRRAVGGPSGVPDAGMPGQVQLGQFGVQVVDPAGLLGAAQPAVVGDHSHPGGVVAAVLQLAQALHDHVQRRTGTHVSNDAAHGHQGTGADPRRRAVS